MAKKQSKLMALKKWLTIPEAAKYLSNMMEEEVSEADILRFALDGHLTLSVNIVNTAYARRGDIVSKDERVFREMELAQIFEEYFEEKDPEVLQAIKKKGNKFKIEKSMNIDDERFINFEDEVKKINGVWDLPMLGCERYEIEHEYQMQTGGPEVTDSYDFEVSAYVQREEGVIYEMRERFNTGKDGELRKASEELNKHNKNIKLFEDNRDFMDPRNFYPPKIRD